MDRISSLPAPVYLLAHLKVKNSSTFALKTSESRLSDEVCSQTRGESSGNRFTVHTVMNLIVFLQHCSKRSFFTGQENIFHVNCHQRS